KGLITTLPLALGRLQGRGEIRRIPLSGRIDSQRYKYAVWNPGPFARKKLTPQQALTELATLFFGWVGPATMKEFQWFSGNGVKATREAIAGLQLQPAEEGSDRLLLPQDVESYRKFKPPADPQYALVSSLDPISANRRDVALLL